MDSTLELILNQVKGYLLSDGMIIYDYAVAERVIEQIINSLNMSYSRIIITGETENVCVYVLMTNKIIVVSPFTDINNNPLLRRIGDTGLDIINTNIIEICGGTKIYTSVINELTAMPRLLLINLSDIEKYPIPRLNLSTGILAAYVRKKQYAHVKILDMQTGLSVDEIYNAIISDSPDIIGISIDFGQKEIAHNLLDRISGCAKINIKVILGNVVPSLVSNKFFEYYPNVVIAYGEGEQCLLDFIDFTKSKLTIDSVSGIYYCENNEIKKNHLKLIDLTDLPVPALDTLPKIAERKGILTYEASRGCDYGRCSFCPRKHKNKKWSGILPEDVVNHIKLLIHAGEKFSLKPHIYFADEEFVGEYGNGSETKRICDICDGIKKLDKNIRFDFSARADSVYDKSRSNEWNFNRLKMWWKCKDAGVDRVFVGAESGCDKQLDRFKKGINVKDNIIALRLLTALGINIRIGFVTFDPLMTGLDEIKENLVFLNRKDILMQSNNIPLELLYDKIINEDEQFINENKQNRPVFTMVSYMISPLEALVGSNYVEMIKKCELRHNVKLIQDYSNIDLNKGRYLSEFFDPIIGYLSKSSQRWIDINFSLMYTIKSLQKYSLNKEKEIYISYMEAYREMSYYFLLSLIDVIENGEIRDKSLLEYTDKKLAPVEVRSFLELANNFKPDFKTYEWADIWDNYFMRRLEIIIFKDISIGVVSSVITDKLRHVDLSEV